MKVWKRQSVVWMLGEKRSSKAVSGAQPRKLLSQKWYGTLRTYEGKSKQVPLTEDRDTSQTLLKTLQRQEDERRANGFSHVQEERQKPIGEHLDAFEAHLRSKDNTDDHVVKTVNRLRKLLGEAVVKSIADLNGTRLVNILAL